MKDRSQNVKQVNDYKSCSSWGTLKHGVLQGSIFGPLFFLYINDIMKITITKDNNNKSTLALFVDDTSLIIISPNPTNFIKDINGALTNINNWIIGNLLSLNFDKTSLIQFLTKNNSHIPISAGCGNNIKSNITHTKFLGIITDTTLTWKRHKNDYTKIKCGLFCS